MVRDEPSAKYKTDGRRVKLGANRQKSDPPKSTAGESLYADPVYRNTGSKNQEGIGEIKSPFDASYFDTVSNWLALHGPALAKLFLIVGSGAATVYNAIKAGHMDGVEIGWMITLILCAAGLIVEMGFAYGWSRRGSYELAGRQRKTVDKIFNESSYVMIGDLSLSVAEIAFGIGGVATIWIGVVQPIMAVRIVRLFYKLKGQHPEYMAQMEVVDMQARMRAMDVRDQAENQRLELAEREHERAMKWAALMKRHEHAHKLVTGRWYSRQVKRVVREAVGRSIGAMRGDLKRLPGMIGLTGKLKKGRIMGQWFTSPVDLDGNGKEDDKQSLN